MLSKDLYVPVICLLKHTQKAKINYGDFRSMSLRELAFFADVKRKVVVRTHIHTITGPKLMVFLHRSVFTYCVWKLSNNVTVT